MSRTPEVVTVSPTVAARTITISIATPARIRTRFTAHDLVNIPSHL